MTCVQRASRNSLIAYGHLFDPRPQPRNTLKKKRASIVDVQAVSESVNELAVGEPTATELSAENSESAESDPPSDTSSPFIPAPQATATSSEDVLPWGWRPRRLSEVKPAAMVTAAELPAEVPARRNESHIERPKVPGWMQPCPSRQPSRSHRPVATYKNYDPNFLMPLPPRKQSQRSRTRHYPARPPARPTAARPYRAMGDRYVTMQNSNQNAVGPAYAQMRRPTRPPMNSFSQMDQRQPSYEQWPRPPSSSSSIRSNMSNVSYGMMHSPVSSQSSFSSYDSSDMPRRPEYGAWQRPMPIKQTRKRREPGELFRVLPTEVLQLILMELKKSHLRPGSDSCATCMMRDLFSVAMTCRRLSKAAHNVLYEDIQIVGADSAAHKKRFKTTAGSRLVLLRRTLRANPELAALVRTLKVPAIPNDLPADKYQDKVASVIMACPNFERLLGFHQPYDHSFSRLFHALSTRENLREMNWFLESAVTEQRQGRSRSQSSSTATPVNNEMGVDIERTTAFFDLHMNWSHLTTLSIYCAQGAVLDGISMFGMTLANMPALQSLHLADLPTTVFNDATLLSLPPLQSLSLCNLQGVSSTGLAAFARRPSSHGIRKLTLRHLGIDSVPALGRLFSNLTALESFTFVQSHAPELPKDEVIWLYPYLASSSLQKLHWDVPTRGSGASEADRILAKSIAFQGYPALRSLRTPNDPDGVFQALCAPLERVEIASDKYRGLIARIPDRIKAPEPSPPLTPVSPSSPFGFGKQSSGMKFTNDPPTPVEPPAPVESHLAQSRLVAQARIEAAKSTPRFQVNVIDEDGTIVDRFGLAGFIGQVESRIRYNIRPDPGATDENGGLTHITDLLKDGGEELKDREGCTGRWLSWSEGITNDKKERERWWHTERGRWRELEMS